METRGNPPCCTSYLAPSGRRWRWGESRIKSGDDRIYQGDEADELTWSVPYRPPVIACSYWRGDLRAMWEGATASHGKCGKGSDTAADDGDVEGGAVSESTGLLPGV